jgi:ribonuclease T1
MRMARWCSRAVLLLGVVSCWSAGGVIDTRAHPDASLRVAAPEQAAAEAEQPVLRSKAPQKARDLLQALLKRDGAPLPGYVGGREFRNRERRLPRGRYREYDVNPTVRGRPRDAERIVIEQRTRKAYYTPDHYRTFVPLN